MNGAEILLLRIFTQGQIWEELAVTVVGYVDKSELLAQRLINLEIPVLVRSLKSSNVELG